MPRRAALAVTLLLLLAACVSAPIRPVDDASGFAEEGFALVAFSVASSGPLALRGLSLATRAGATHDPVIEQVTVQPRNGKSQLFLYRVPAAGARFGPVRFYDGSGWWETTRPGPEFPAAPGAITYLGRIQLQAVRVGEYVDTGRRYPAEVSLTISDATVEDLPALAERFAVPAGMPVVGKIPGAWDASAYVRLRYQQVPGRDDADDYLDAWKNPVPVGPAPSGRRRDSP